LHFNQEQTQHQTLVQWSGDGDTNGGSHTHPDERLGTHAWRDGDVYVDSDADGHAWPNGHTHVERHGHGDANGGGHTHPEALSH